MGQSLVWGYVDGPRQIRGGIHGSKQGWRNTFHCPGFPYAYLGLLGACAPPLLTSFSDFDIESQMGVPRVESAVRDNTRARLYKQMKNDGRFALVYQPHILSSHDDC